VKRQPPYHLSSLAALLVTLVALFSWARAVENREARLTVIVHDVRLLPAHTAARPAALNENVRPGTAVKTGTESRAELTFANASITRLGANTVFSFNEEARTIELGSGTILVNVPKSAGEITINMPVATAAISGFTGLFSTAPNSYSKIIVVEGRACVRHRHARASEACINLFAGDEFVIRPDGRFPPNAVQINLAKIVQGPLFTKFPPLPEWNLVLAEVQKQRTNPPSGGLTDATDQDARDQNISAHPMPTPKPIAIPKPTPQPTLPVTGPPTGSPPMKP
jgi:FecR protein